MFRYLKKFSSPVQVLFGFGYAPDHRDPINKSLNKLLKAMPIANPDSRNAYKHPPIIPRTSGVAINITNILLDTKYIISVKAKMKAVITIPAIPPAPLKRTMYPKKIVKPKSKIDVTILIQKLGIMFPKRFAA